MAATQPGAVTLAGAMDLEATAKRLRTEELSASRLAEQALDAAETARDRLGAFVTITHDVARQAAAIADKEFANGRDRGILHGVPVALKDNISLKGAPLTASSRVLADHVADTDAYIVGRLRDAGAVIIGKTALDEFAFATVGDGISNPVDPGRTPGGSSGGSAVAVASGVCPVALGTDTGGSVRIPAACCRVVGLKPTVRRLSTSGVIPLAWTLDHLGVLASTVNGAAKAYAALQGGPDIVAAPAKDRLRIGVPAGEFMDPADPAVRRAFEAALDALRAGGHELLQVPVPSSDVALHLQYLIVLAEAAAYHLSSLRAEASAYTDGVREAIEWGRRVTALDYIDAQCARSQLHDDVQRALEGLDGLLLPTLPVLPPAVGQGEITLGNGRLEDVVSAMLRYTCVFNHAGHPAISLPAEPPGETPLGVQVVGHFGQDREMLHVAARVEALLRG